MLGALAIVIAILIVLNAQDRKDQEQTPAPTITEHDHRDHPVLADRRCRDWTEQGPIGHGGAEFGVTRLNAMAPQATVQVTPSPTDPQCRRPFAPEQTSQ